MDVIGIGIIMTFNDCNEEKEEKNTLDMNTLDKGSNRSSIFSKGVKDRWWWEWNKIKFVVVIFKNINNNNKHLLK